MPAAKKASNQIKITYGRIAVMKFGIYLPNFGPYRDARVLANLAQDAEQAGWNGFFIWDHVAG